MPKYLQRNLLSEVEKWMNKGYVVILKGARQVGKTTLLKMLMEKYGGTYIDLTDEEWAERLSKDPLSFSNLEQPIFLDEIGMVKNAGRSLKLLYDEKRIKMVVTGSGAFEVKENIRGYLVGRAISLTLYPLTFEEFLLWKSFINYDWYMEIKEKIKSYLAGKTGKFPEIPEMSKLELYYKEFAEFGGYPGVVLASQEDKKTILKNIVESQLEKDIFQFFDIREKEKFKNFLKYMSFNVGGIFNAHSTGLSNPTVWNYVSILEMEYILKLLWPYYRNLSTELRKSKKIYFYDTGIARFLSENRLNIGQETENFVFSQLIKKYSESSLRYWRTQGGAEIDFLILNKNEPSLPLEVKTGSKKSRALFNFLSIYNLKRGVIIANSTKLEKKQGKEVVYLQPWWI